MMLLLKNIDSFHHQTDVSSHVLFIRFWNEIQQNDEKNKKNFFCWQEQCASNMFQFLNWKS